MSKHTRFIRQEIKTWREEGLVNPDLADALKARYPLTDDGVDWARMVPTAAGAVIFGLGIILFFAYNWEDMHRFVKLGLLVFALLAAHGAALWSGSKGKSPGLVDALHLLGTMLFGAGIWLVAQVYHIDEHYPNAYLIWSLMALAMAWTLNSRSQGLLALALAAIWGGAEIFDFYQAQHPASWLIALGVVPLAMVLRSNLLLFFGVTGFVFLHTFSLINIDDDLVFSVLLLLATLLLALCKLMPTAASDGFQPATILYRVGFAIWMVLVFVGTFAEIELDEIADLPKTALNWVYWGIPAVGTVAAWGWVYVRGIIQTRNEQLASVACLLVLASILLVSVVGAEVVGITWGAFSIAFLLMAGVTVSRGLQELRWSLTALGTLMFAAFVFARFMDLFDSLLLRSAMFVVVGVALFVVGQLFNRRRRAIEQAQTDA